MTAVTKAPKFYVGVKASQKAKPRLSGPAAASYDEALTLAKMLFKEQTARRVQTLVADAAPKAALTPISISGAKGTQIDYVIIEAQTRGAAWAVANGK